MKFKSKGQPLSDAGLDSICDLLGVPDAAIWAILTVETRGFGFFYDRCPQILFERHIFHKYTNGKFSQDNGDISAIEGGGYIGGPSEYKRLKKAMKLNQEAALMSTSWGIAQVMGFNYEIAGFNSVNAMVKGMVKDETQQLLAMANFIKGNDLAGVLQSRDWVSFARRYNGPGFKKNEYDTRLAAAYAKYEIILPDLSLRSAQAALGYLGFNPGPVDGLRGRRTHSALLLFQQKEGLTVTGELNRETEDKLIDMAFT